MYIFKLCITKLYFQRQNKSIKIKALIDNTFNTFYSKELNSNNNDNNNENIQQQSSWRLSPNILNLFAEKLLSGAQKTTALSFE